MIDLHIAVQKSTPVDYINQALKSVNDPLFNVHTLHDCSSILEARIKGFSMGSSDYVTFCDDDDQVINIHAIEQIVKTKPNAFFTNSNIINGYGEILRPYYPKYFTFHTNDIYLGVKRPHQMMVVNRSIAEKAMDGVIKYINERGYVEKSWPVEVAFIYEVAKQTSWLYYNVKCYNWRIHSKTQMHKSKNHMQHIAEINQYYNKELAKGKS